MGRIRALVTSGFDDGAVQIPLSGLQPCGSSERTGTVDSGELYISHNGMEGSKHRAQRYKVVSKSFAVCSSKHSFFPPLPFYDALVVPILEPGSPTIVYRHLRLESYSHHEGLESEGPKVFGERIVRYGSLSLPTDAS